MKQLITKFDLYRLYERVCEGVILDVTIDYDIGSMIKTGAINDSNLKITKVEVPQEAKTFLVHYPFDIDRIVREVEIYFEDDFDHILEDWGEDVPNEEYSKVENIINFDIDNQNSPEPRQLPVHDITQILENL